MDIEYIQLKYIFNSEIYLFYHKALTAMSITKKNTTDFLVKLLILLLFILLISYKVIMKYILIATSFYSEYILLDSHLNGTIIINIFDI